MKNYYLAKTLVYIYNLCGPNSSLEFTSCQMIQPARFDSRPYIKNGPIWADEVAGNFELSLKGLVKLFDSIWILIWKYIQNNGLTIVWQNNFFFYQYMIENGEYYLFWLGNAIGILQWCPVFVPQIVCVSPWAPTENLESMQLVTVGVVDDSGWDETNLAKSNLIWQIELSILQA